MKETWCKFTHPEYGHCAFGPMHKIEYHYCNGRRFDQRGKPLSSEDFDRITRSGTR